MLSLEYMAGMVDADGCIRLQESNYKYQYPALQVTNTSKALMHYLVGSFGGKILLKQKKGFVTKLGVRSTSDCFDWRLGGAAARSLISDLIPHLIVKKDKAISVLAADFRKAA